MPVSLRTVPRFRGTRALVLEPHAQRGVALVDALECLGVSVTRTERPCLASALLQRADREDRPFDVLIVADEVGGIGGLELAAALGVRVRRRPVLLLATGPFSAPSRDRLARALCSGVVMVPPRPSQLEAALAACLVPMRREGAPRRNRLRLVSTRG